MLKVDSQAVVITLPQKTFKIHSIQLRNGGIHIWTLKVITLKIKVANRSNMVWQYLVLHFGNFWVAHHMKLYWNASSFEYLVRNALFTITKNTFTCDNDLLHNNRFNLFQSTIISFNTKSKTIVKHKHFIHYDNFINGCHW